MASWAVSFICLFFKKKGGLKHFGSQPHKEKNVGPWTAPVENHCHEQFLSLLPPPSDSSVYIPPVHVEELSK